MSKQTMTLSYLVTATLRRRLRYLLAIGLACLTAVHLPPVRAEEPRTEWKAGLASAIITPEEPMWMAGYASRNKPSEGKVHELRAKALALEDARGTRLVIVAADILGIPRTLRDRLEKECGQRYGLPPEGLLINASHTHCGPEINELMAFVWCVPEGPIPSVGWEAAREGIDDHRYLRTLRELIAKAEAAGKGAAAQQAMKFLKGLRDRIHPEHYGKAYTEADERGKKEGRHGVSLFERAPPEPALKLDDYTGVRRRAVEHVIRLQNVLADK